MKNHTVSIYVPDDTMKLLNKAAKDESRTISNMVVKLIKDALDGKK